VELQCIIQNLVIDILEQVYLHVHVGVIRFPAGPNTIFYNQRGNQKP
jgi:hypothetical protein